MSAGAAATGLDLDLVDTHAHLPDPRLCSDLPGVLGRAREAGVGRIIAIGTTADDSAVACALAAAHPGVSAAVGLQPNDLIDARPDDWNRIVPLADRPGVVAIGETGLDRYWDRTPFALQQQSFDRHLDLAAEKGLPVVIHCRDCERDIVAHLERRGGPVRGVLHSFAGSWDDAQAFLAVGLHLSFSGMITFANKGLDPLRSVAARVPADRLLIETDSPYLSPHPFRGNPNEPARVAVTAEALGRLRGIPPAEVAALTTANALLLFRLSDALLDPMNRPADSASPAHEP